MPLVGTYDGNAAIELFEAPDHVERGMRHYTGSIAFDATGQFLAVSSPRGHLITFWEAATGTFLHEIKARDSSGVVASGRDGEFLISGGDGKLRAVNVRTRESTVLSTLFELPHWDNHIAAKPLVRHSGA